MARRSTLRASDEDREQIAERLRGAAADGRLLAHEFEERLARALRARTFGELDVLVADLPAAVERRRPRTMRSWVVPAVGLAIAIPIALALIMAVLFVLAGVLAMGGVWLFVGWWLLGHRGRMYGRPCPRRRRPPQAQRSHRVHGAPSARAAQPRPELWL